jgi:hypothetical protein
LTADPIQALSRKGSRGGDRDVTLAAASGGKVFSRERILPLLDRAARLMPVRGSRDAMIRFYRKENGGLRELDGFDSEDGKTLVIARIPVHYDTSLEIPYNTLPLGIVLLDDAMRAISHCRALWRRISWTAACGSSTPRSAAASSSRSSAAQ